ncbi:MAG: PepSY-like domain-containing protein [Rikenellaceae bacterium]
MKKLFFALFALLFSVSTLSAEERVIDHHSLPKTAQQFIATHYAADKVSIATMERGVFDKDYKVILTSGVKLEFDGSGEWTEIECKRNSEVPMKVVPSKVANYVSKRFPKSKIVKIERDKRSVDVELNNDMELKFNNKGDLIEIDS